MLVWRTAIYDWTLSWAESRDQWSFTCIISMFENEVLNMIRGIIPW
jgi:hypothetical protein